MCMGETGRNTRRTAMRAAVKIAMKRGSDYT